MYVNINSKDIGVIFLCRKSVLFFKGEVWIKKKNGNFDVPQGSYDGAGVSELMGIFLLSKSKEIVYIDDHWFIPV